MICPRILATIIALTISVGVGAEALCRTRVIFSVDVETNENFTLPTQMNTVCRDGSPCGLMEIARLLKERQWAGTFFLSVFEQRKWGEAAMKDLALTLQSAGQDVALHTHPQWAFVSSQPFMHQYSLEEQTAIIGEGVRLLSSWTGRPVVAHRAGAYAADERTLEALERNGLKVDSSLFLANPRCRLGGLSLPNNLPSHPGALVEVPVTVYQREEKPRFFGDMLAPVTSVRKIDPDWFIDENETRAAIDAVLEADIPFLVVFLHSFSLLSAPDITGQPEADTQTRKNFQAILDKVSESGLAVVTMRDVAEENHTSAATHAQDILPRVSVIVSLPRFILHRLRVATRSELAVGAATFLVFAVACALLIVHPLRRRIARARADEE